VTRYRASPTVCNSCQVKDTCTTSDKGREISRNIDPWPHSEAGRFHRGIACSVAVLAILLPLVSMIGRSALEAGILALVAAGATVASWPMWSHLRRAPAGFPEHVPVERAEGAAPPQTPRGPDVGTDRFTTTWGGFSSSEPSEASATGWNRIKRP